ncbi:MAG TPA: DUF1697 domain-containing protein [Herpetosiphonaceae bacterium]
MSAAQQYIAFLRAINVGGHTVKMADLRALFEELSFANVATFIASGNVIFESPNADARALEAQIERHLKQALGYEVATFLRTTAELAAIAAYQPFAKADAEGSSLYISFVAAPPTKEARQKLMALRSPTDDFHVHGREIYWLCRTKLSESAFSGALLEKTIGMPATMRSATTVKKLAAKYPAPQ